MHEQYPSNARAIPSHTTEYPGFWSHLTLSKVVGQWSCFMIKRINKTSCSIADMEHATVALWSCFVFVPAFTILECVWTWNINKKEPISSLPRVILSQTQNQVKQGWIHGYPSHVRVGRGHFWGHLMIWAGAVGPKTAKKKRKRKSKVWQTDGPTDKAGCRVA